jgi:ribosome-binding ATPase YchF (GTP1/OBG family)
MEDIKKLHDELLVIDIDICVNQLEELEKELSRVGRKWGYGAKRSANEINEDIEKTKKKTRLVIART